MPDDPLTGLLNESASLWHVVHSIERHIRQKLASYTYTGATDQFFLYILDLAEGTKSVLSSNAVKVGSGEVRRARLEVATLRQYWLLLHELIQPAGEAHSLSAPAALIELAAEQLRQIAGLQDSKVVVSLSPRLMYHQTTHTRLSALGKKIEQSIPGARFPRQLGFVALPFSQGPSFFANLLLYHELGHFVFEELSVAAAHATLGDLDAKLIAAVDDAIAGREDLGPEVRAFAVRVLRNWTHEIFCDLFAICLIGPAFSFAFIELLALLDFLESSVTVVFNPSHPALACRFRQHFEILKSSGWWEHLVHLQAPTKDLIQRLADRSENEYLLQLDGNSQKDAVLIPAFLNILPHICNSVVQITKPALAAPAEFASNRNELEKCLMNGIVPSVPLGQQQQVGSPVSVINASFTFYLSSLEALMKQLGKEPRDIEARSDLKHKLEQWAQKALEDIQLLHRRDEVTTHGRSIKK